MKKTSTNHVFAQWVRRLSLAIAFVTFAVCSYAQQRVTGTVLDAKGEPVIGASVVVEGTTNGTTTGIDGKFALNVPARAQLTVSFLGYKSRKIDVAGKTDLAVTLEEDVAMLDDVVVIGYGTVKKRDLTGAVASMKSGDITIAPTGNAMEALQGKVAGMDIVKNSGQIGDNPQIQLRGSRSIYGSNEPLFIIDGFPGSYDQVNPSDIESIDVLKDASSTAIYGSAGANGVVMITTKRGKAGKATVNLDMYYGISGSPNYTHGMTGAEWVAYQSEAYAMQHVGPLRQPDLHRRLQRRQMDRLGGRGCRPHRRDAEIQHFGNGRQRQDEGLRFGLLCQRPGTAPQRGARPVPAAHEHRPGDLLVGARRLLVAPYLYGPRPRRAEHFHGGADRLPARRSPR